MPTTSRQRIIASLTVNKPVTAVFHCIVTVQLESNKSQFIVKEMTMDVTTRTINVQPWELFNNVVQLTCSSALEMEEFHQKSTIQPEVYQPNTLMSESQMVLETLRQDSTTIREKDVVFNSRISDREETLTTSFLKITVRNSAQEFSVLLENHSRIHLENATWNAHQLVLEPTHVHLLTPVSLLLAQLLSEESVVHVRSTCASCQENKVTVEHIPIVGGSMLKPETAKSLSILDVKEMLITSKRTKNAKITVEMLAVSHNVFKEPLLLIPTETSLSVEDLQLLLPPVQLIITVIMMEPPMDVVQLKLTLVHCLTNLEHLVDQLSLVGIMILQLELVRHTLSMVVMETLITLPLNKIVRITVELNHVQMEEKYGRSRMEQHVLVQLTDNAHLLITVHQLPHGLEPFTKQRVSAVHQRISYALNHVTSELDVLAQESPDGTSMLIQRHAKHLNIMDVKEIAITLLLKSLVKTIVFRKPVHQELLLPRMEMEADLFNAQIQVEMEEFPVVVPMVTLVILHHFLIRMFAAELRLNFNLSALLLQLHSFLLSHFNQCNVLQMLMELALETSSAGSQLQQHQSMLSTAADPQTLLIQDTAHHNLFLYQEKTEPSTNTALHQLHSMTPSRVVEPTDIANSPLIWKDISVVDLSQMFDCRMFAHHNQLIWFQSSWLETIGRAIHMLVLELHNLVQTTQHVFTRAMTMDSSVAEFSWEMERVKQELRGSRLCSLKFLNSFIYFLMFFLDFFAISFPRTCVFPTKQIIFLHNLHCTVVCFSSINCSFSSHCFSM